MLPRVVPYDCRAGYGLDQSPRYDRRKGLRRLAFSEEDHAMDRNELIIAEARLNGRLLTAERSVEIAREVEALMKASLELGSRLAFDDQASDFAFALLETAERRSR
jgi:hypothetical protein